MSVKLLDIRKLNKTLLNNHWVKAETSGEIRNDFELKEMKI